ncbi:MAG: hypothetical protein ACYC26_00725 [Phycisphaerales bacterium]
MTHTDLQTLPPFRPAAFHRRLAASVAAQRLLLSLFFVGWVFILIPRFTKTHWPDAFILAGLIGWFFANYASSRTARLALESLQLASVEAPTPQVEHVLAQALPRFTLYRNMRYMLHHHLAVLRHRQHRYDESAWIAATLLEQLPRRDSLQRVRSSHASLRVKLLILLADAALFQQQLPTAYFALRELHTHRLDLTQTMQVLEIQTRYQLAVGQARLALDLLPRKLAITDLMPLPHAVQMHHLLALAADADRRPHTAAYLRRRADLLTPAPGIAPGPAPL